MAIDIGSALLSGAVAAAFCAIYGFVIGVFWTPFLIAKRFRRLFAELLDTDWRATYTLLIPLPAIVWGFFFGSVLELSPDLRPPSAASPSYLGGIDGIVVATLVSSLLWPTLLLYILPRVGIDWDPNEYPASTIILILSGLGWYLMCLIGPAYVLSVFAGFGDAMSGT